ncbi:18234_t:CDS:2, partial [Rhizophagus irregularis]
EEALTGASGIRRGFIVLITPILKGLVMSYFPRADDFAPAPGYDHTPAGLDDFIFNHDTSRTDNKIPDVSNCKTFKDFHATRLYNRWAKKKKYQNFSNRLGISFTTSYHAYNTNVVATKGLDFIYCKKYGNLQFIPSSSPKVKKRQEARFNALVRHTFHNAKLDDNAQTNDKLRAARHHKLLFQENQRFTAPIRHLRYKKKFIEPSQGYYTFPIPFPESKTVSVPVIAETICNISSVASTSNDNPIPPANTDNWENVPEHYIPLIP